MAITKEVLDELLREYKGPDDFYGPEGLVKRLSKALIEKALGDGGRGSLGFFRNLRGCGASRRLPRRPPCALFRRAQNVYHGSQAWTN